MQKLTKKEKKFRIKGIFIEYPSIRPIKEEYKIYLKATGDFLYKNG